MNQRTDYDNPWKEALSLYFQDFMAFFFPQIEANIDWERGYEFLDKEFQQIIRESELGRKEADKLVKVWRRDGEEIWVLIHIEIQSQAKSDFPERMYVYNNRIFDVYRRPVVSLAILADEQSSWRPDRYHYELWGCQIELRFPSVKLLDYLNLGEDLDNSNNPFAVIVAAHLATQQTKQDVSGRYDGKLRIAKSLYQRGYSRHDILELFRLIDWMMSLPELVENEFKREIQRFEGENQMPYVTSFERITRREDIFEVLEVRFSEIPSELVEKVNQIKDFELLKTLLREAITVGSLTEFQSYLEQTD